MDSIIFDLDGTLWDAVEAILATWKEVLKGHEDIGAGITKEDLQGVMGLQIKEIGEKLFPGIEEKKVEALLHECCEKECGYLKKYGANPYPKLQETLDYLASKYKLFIVSNCQAGYIEVFLEYYKLEKYFIDFENPERTGLSKGENIKLIMERNGLKASVYVGDTLGDQKAANMAGIPFVYAAYGFGEVEDFQYQVDSIEELKELF